MTEDASLDDFLDAADDQEAETDDADGPDDDANATADGDANTPADGDDGPVSSSEGTDDTATSASEGAGDDASRDPAAVEPAAATYDWTPGGAACAACDEVVERRWRDESGFVCESCKDW